MEKWDARQLLENFRNGKSTAEEQAILEKWYLTLSDFELDLSIDDIDEIGKEIWAELPIHQPKRTTRLWPRIAAAAMIALTLGVGTYVHFNQQHAGTTTYTSDIKPGSNKAVLTLADGRRISLTDASAGVIAAQSGIKISKTANGQLIYEISNAATGNANQYNTIEVPRSGQYQVRLPDGTSVWLNAASSLKYPVSFAKQATRQVTLTGEGYFEVTHSAKQPFIVKTNTEAVQVLGTHFNINTYTDEPETVTTLFQGSVKITPQHADAGTAKILKPGEQGILRGTRLNVTEADTQAALSWKNGYFIFKNESIPSIMRKIARWYDAEVVYADDVSDVTYEGSISRFKNVSELLHKFELTGTLKFKLEGRRITIMK